jgi:hypothetical protein
MTATGQATGTEPVLTVSLDYPIEFDSQRITELVFDRRPKAKDFKGLPAGNFTFDETLLLVSRLTGVPVPAVNELDIADFTKVMKGVSSFLPDGLSIGESQ